MIRGCVTDEKGLPIADATVGLYKVDIEIIQSHSDRDGKFTFDLGLKYQDNLLIAKASREGFESGEVKYRVREGKELRIPLRRLISPPPPPPLPPPTPTPLPLPPDNKDTVTPTNGDNNGSSSQHKLKKVLVVIAVVVGFFAVSGAVVWIFNPVKKPVPSVIGRSISEAINTLQTNRLGWIIATNASSAGQEPGTVLEEDPAGGTVVTLPTNIQLTVDPGLQVPPLENLAVRLAERDLNDAGLTFHVTESNAPLTMAPGIVWKQYPLENAFVKAGLRIELYVQPGLAPHPVPVGNSPLVGTWVPESDPPPRFAKFDITSQNNRLTVTVSTSKGQLPRQKIDYNLKNLATVSFNINIKNGYFPDVPVRLNGQSSTGFNLKFWSTPSTPWHFTLKLQGGKTVVAEWQENGGEKLERATYTKTF
jgi:hypothetical protein